MCNSFLRRRKVRVTLEEQLRSALAWESMLRDSLTEKSDTFCI